MDYPIACWVNLREWGGGVSYKIHLVFCQIGVHRTCSLFQWIKEQHCLWRSYIPWFMDTFIAWYGRRVRSADGIHLDKGWTFSVQEITFFGSKYPLFPQSYQPLSLYLLRIGVMVNPRRSSLEDIFWALYWNACIVSLYDHDVTLWIYIFSTRMHWRIIEGPPCTLYGEKKKMMACQCLGYHGAKYDANRWSGE